jgi:thioredoxin 2
MTENETDNTEKKRITLQCQFCQKWNRLLSERAADRPRCGECQRPFLLDRPYPLTDESSGRVLAETDIPILVDFFADWCGPCKIMAPAVDALAAEYEGRALIAKLNTDFNKATAAAHQIQGIPTTIVFRAGSAVERQTGAVTRQTLQALLNSALAAA